MIGSALLLTLEWAAAALFAACLVLGIAVNAAFLAAALILLAVGLFVRDTARGWRRPASDERRRG